MVVRLVSGDVFGIEGRAVDVEVALLKALHSFVVTGLAGKGIRESRERVRSAIVSCGLPYPDNRRVVVNLAPATWEKDGCVFDLAIALGILIQNDQMTASGCWGVLGELSLDGSVRPVPGILGMVAALRDAGVARVLVPAGALAEAAAVPGVRVIGVGGLRAAIDVMEGSCSGIAPAAPTVVDAAPPTLPDFSEVIGHERIKRAFAVAAAGGHNVLLVGPPGAGKTLLARRLPALLPPMSSEEQRIVTQIHSAAGLGAGDGLLLQRPFRSPHHTVSWAGLVGGGSMPRPGEVTLAHRGVLFLDELPEFPRSSLEALREPLEGGQITIARSRATLTFPADFLLVAAMNPCPCGHAMSRKRVCECRPDRIRKYIEKVSGPLLDRIDMRLEVQSVPGHELLQSATRSPGDTAALRQSVRTATDFRIKAGRQCANCALEWADRASWAQLTRPAEDLLRVTSDELDLSTRSLTRMLRLARTIADIDEVGRLEERHILEAVEYHSPRSGGSFLRWLAAH
ncbi:MAG: YifB family Mg chelatase-like AAA ATPase [Planctomycetota bacterium]